jgi:hypothetical protein
VKDIPYINYDYSNPNACEQHRGQYVYFPEFFEQTFLFKKPICPTVLAELWQLKSVSPFDCPTHGILVSHYDVVSGCEPKARPSKHYGEHSTAGNDSLRCYVF